MPVMPARANKLKITTGISGRLSAGRPSLCAAHRHHASPMANTKSEMPTTAAVDTAGGVASDNQAATRYSQAVKLIRLVATHSAGTVPFITATTPFQNSTSNTPSRGTR